MILTFIKLTKSIFDFETHTETILMNIFYREILKYEEIDLKYKEMFIDLKNAQYSDQIIFDNAIESVKNAEIYLYRSLNSILIKYDAQNIYIITRFSNLLKKTVSFVAKFGHNFSKVMRRLCSGKLSKSQCENNLLSCGTLINRYSVVINSTIEDWFLKLFFEKPIYLTSAEKHILKDTMEHFKIAKFLSIFFF
ncbi:hypothetical protein CDIK_0315 [Cucumispora dikerogammari]|nr:hypothetical protein CDIK_0315 [Cucumispora dikerogammari]